ncbi:MAG: beta-N-acetylhexosaminidase [Elusimicrobia bacterium]|nr:beta-N-acetylhexosaminidase [Elusimicrobiota bacterium]
MAGSIFRLPDQAPFGLLARAYPGRFSLSQGLRIEARKRGRMGYRIEPQSGKLLIEHGERSDIMRALGSLLSRPDIKKELGEPPLAFRGLMLDVSRNGVIRVPALKTVLLRLALLGYNRFCLYTEDTCEVKGHPLIGYRRGRYSQRELSELDAFARALGIEMFPCIQTLGHLEQVIKHERYWPLRDNERVLSVEHPRSRKLVETLIRQARKPYQSGLIHLGLDETWGIGRGETFIHKKPMDPRWMYLRHVRWLASVCRRLKLKPMMWGDVVVGCHEKAMDPAQRKALPKGMTMVYWDYYREQAALYEKRIEEYRKMGYEPLCSPGIWNWGCLWPSYRKVSRTLPVFMKKAKEMGIKRMMATAWGDDGQESPFDANWPALCLFAEEAYERADGAEGAKARMRAVCGADYDAVVRVGDLELYPGKESLCGSLGKALLWEDPMAGRISHGLGKLRLSARFRRLAGRIRSDARKMPSDFHDLFAYACALAEFLVLKADIFNETRSAYVRRDKAALRKIASSIPARVRALDDLHAARKKLWFAEFKPFGWEVLDGRFGGLRARLLTMKERLDAYLAGRLPAIEELDEKPAQEFASLAGKQLTHAKLHTASWIH